jgi:hypothetical protein
VTSMGQPSEDRQCRGCVLCDPEGYSRDERLEALAELRQENGLGLAMYGDGLDPDKVPISIRSEWWQLFEDYPAQYTAAELEKTTG